LSAFWNSHDPAYEPYSRQYRSAIFYANEEQKKLALESKKQEELKRSQPMFTDIEELKHFYLAEGYHQKFYLQENPGILADFGKIYSSDMDVMNSPAAAKVNGYLAGYGDADLLLKQVDKLGLSEDNQQTLKKIALSGLTSACPVTNGKQP
jgi:hypothetical protein